MTGENQSLAINNMKSLFLHPEKVNGCIQVRSIDELPEPQLSLNEWRFPDDNLKYLGELAARSKEYWQIRKEIQDDSVPCISPFYGIAEHSAFLGGEVIFTPQTSYHLPMLNTLGDFRSLQINRDNDWARMLQEGYDYLLENWSDYFYIKYRGAYGPFDLASVLRGSEFYLDLYDEPELMLKYMEFCLAAVREYLAMQTEKVPLYAGGRFSGFNIWMPDASVGHLSDDASCLCSPEQYDRFGKPYLAELISRYSSSLLHIHSAGGKNVPQFAAMKKISILQISSDPNQPESSEVLAKYKNLLLSKIIIIDADATNLDSVLKTLKNMRYIIFYNARTIEEAKYAVAHVRQNNRLYM